METPESKLKEEIQKAKAIPALLEKAVDDALAAADLAWERDELKRYPSIGQIAESVFDGNPELMEDAKRPVLIDRLYWLAKRRRTARFSQKFGQLELPGLELPRTVYLKNGQRNRTDYCNGRQIEEAIKVLESQQRDRQNPKIQRLRNALSVMEPYRADNRDILWVDVKKKELERRDFERMLRAE